MTGGGGSCATRGAAGGDGLAGVGSGDGSNGFADGGGSTAFAAEPRSDCHSEGVQWPSGVAVPHPNSMTKNASIGRGKRREGVRIATARRYDKSVAVVYAFDACSATPVHARLRCHPPSKKAFFFRIRSIHCVHFLAIAPMQITCTGSFRGVGMQHREDMA